MPRKIQHQSLKSILEYLAKSDKIIFDKNDKIVNKTQENMRLR